MVIASPLPKGNERRLSTMSDDGLAQEEARLNEYSRWLKKQMETVDALAQSALLKSPVQSKTSIEEGRRTPLGSIENTPRSSKQRKTAKPRKSLGTPSLTTTITKSSTPSSTTTPATTRRAIDAVLEAVSDVLVMEATIQETESPFKETSTEIPYAWQHVISTMTHSDVDIPIVSRISTYEEEMSFSASTNTRHEDSGNSFFSPWLWAVCGGGCWSSEFAVTTDTSPRRVVVIEFDDSLDDNEDNLVSPSSFIYSS
mmetsp:Transcript_23794/g.30957  ORF Transcript_23794/g.30957 Transcript_23794/m.30957 type:complete len:256 (+) Transcript_23794:50-817(+)